MSWQAKAQVEQIARQYKLTPHFAQVLDKIADAADKEGKGTYQSVLTLMIRSRTSRSTVKRALAFFRDNKIIVPGDQSLVAHIDADNRPVVYNMILDPNVRMHLMMRGIKKPRKSLYRPVEKPVDKPVDKEIRGVTDDTENPISGCQGDTQTSPLLKTNQEPAVPASPEVVDYEAVIALRQASRDRLAQRGIIITEPLPAAPSTSPAAHEQSSPAGQQSPPSSSPVPASPQPALPVDPAPARRPQAPAPAGGGSALPPAGSSSAVEPASCPRVPSAERSVPVPAPGRAPVFAVPESFLRLPGLSPSAARRVPDTDTRRLLGTGCR